MLSSTDDAISVRDTSSLGNAGVPTSLGVPIWAAAQGGVEISPGTQDGVETPPAKVTPARIKLKAVHVTNGLRFFMFSPKVSSNVPWSLGE